MKMKILFGSLLAVFLMMMLPTVSAVDYNTVKETMKSQYPIIIPDIDIEELKLKYQNNPEPTYVILFILMQIIRLLRIVKFSILSVLLVIIIITFPFLDNSTS